MKNNAGKTRKDPFQGPSEEDMEKRGLDTCGKKLMLCPYCKRRAEWVENKEVYGNNIGKSVMIWLCRECDAYVGCHRNTRTSLGTMANAATRKWRKLAHAMVDPIWRNKRLTRGQTYEYMSRYLGFDVHIGKADVKICKQIVHFCHTNKWFNEMIKEK